jgi:peptide/nickel transport system substrate-binding protein
MHRMMKMIHGSVLRHRNLLTALMAAILLVPAVGCGGTPAPSAPAAKAPTKFTVAVLSEPGSLDPNTTSGLTVVSTYMFNDLASWSSSETKTVPGLAEKWENIDPLTWKFTLRKGVKFQNGDPMTSADVQFTFYRIMGRYDSTFRSTGGTALKGMIDNIEIPDAYTVIFHTKYPQAAMESIVHYVMIVPKAYIEKVGDDGFANKPIGTGPYRFKERAIGESLTLEAFRDYFNSKPGPGEMGPPTVDQVVYRFIPEEQSRINAVKTGEADAAQDLSTDSAKPLEKDPKIKVNYTTLNQPLFLAMSWQTDKDPQTGAPNPLADVRVRQAMNCAIDIDALMKSFGTGREYRTTMLGKDGIGYNADVPYYKYDPAKARQLLAEAGYPNGFSVKWYTFQPQPIFQSMQKYFKDVGIDAQLQATTLAVAYTQITSGKFYGMIVWTSNTGPDPMPQFLDQWVMSTGMWKLHARNADLEKLVEQSRSEFDVQKRGKIYDQIIQTLWKDAWFVPLWETVQISIIKSDWNYDHPSRITGIYFPALQGKK